MMRLAVFAMVAGLALPGLGCSTAIQQGIDEAAANEVLTSLARAGIPASKARDENGYSVTVAAGDALGAMELLRSLGLPRGPRAGLGEVYKSPSLLPTPTEERARYVAGLSGEIERSLEAFDGVVLARVHLVLPEHDPFSIDGVPRVPARAAVLLKLRAGQAAPIGEAEARKLVAGSVPGLDPAAVAVVFTTTAALSPASRETPLVALGPWRMAAASRASVVAVGAVLLAALVVLAALVLLLARRLAALQRRDKS
jgi:type III secretion protein J